MLRSYLKNFAIQWQSQWNIIIHVLDWQGTVAVVNGNFSFNVLKPIYWKSAVLIVQNSCTTLLFWHLCWLQKSCSLANPNKTISFNSDFICWLQKDMHKEYYYLRSWFSNALLTRSLLVRYRCNINSGFILSMKIYW